MEDKWYVYNNNKVEGPFSKRDIHSMLSSGEVKDNNQAWSKELGEWKPISQIGLLGEGISIPDETQPNENTSQIEVPQPDPHVWGEAESPNLYGDSETHTVEIDTKLNQVRPWVRYFAKMTDIIFFGNIFAILLALISIEGYFAFYSNELIAGMLLLLIYNFYEALMLSLWGTTIGKWFLGTSVKNIRGDKLSYLSALSRSFRVYIEGFGIGIPLVSFITLIMSYNSLVKSDFGKTNWDFLGGHRVEHSKLNPFKIFGLIILWIIFAWLMVD